MIWIEICLLPPFPPCKKETIQPSKALSMKNLRLNYEVCQSYKPLTVDSYIGKYWETLLIGSITSPAYNKGLIHI